MNEDILDQERFKPPVQLKILQEWFANIISRPLGKNQLIEPYTSQGKSIVEESAHYITPNQTLLSYERIQIYNQQYWWRLLKVLHLNFPLVTRLFGSLNFNEKIGVPYLLHHRPNHWSFNEVGKHLVKWIKECYLESNQSLVLDAAHIDWAFMQASIAPQKMIPNFSQMVKDQATDLLSCIFYLQPHLNLFSWKYNLLNFREILLQQNVDYWINEGIPNLKEEATSYFLLYRNFQNNLAWREISKEEFLLLEYFKTGASLSSICQFIEKQEPLLYEKMAYHLQNWLQGWAQLGWLTLMDI